MSHRVRLEEILTFFLMHGNLEKYATQRRKLTKIAVACPAGSPMYNFIDPVILSVGISLSRKNVPLRGLCSNFTVLYSSSSHS